MIPRRRFISFSGGETSGFMSRWLLAHRSAYYDEICTVFANTGQENEATLDFVQRCDEAFGLGVVWVEAEVHLGERKAPTARVVNFHTADRTGKPFEDMIRKYGIPNTAFPHCTRVLKLSAMTDYMRQIGWASGSYDTAIGIRSDEIDRISSEARKRRLIYPLITDIPMTKPAINEFWSRQTFRLGLRGYQGNCKWCWKKSLRKHLTLMSETPEIFDFPERMEREYGLIGPEFQKITPPGYRRVFFRKATSTRDLRAEHALLSSDFVPAPDDAAVPPTFEPGLDVGGGCSESCEVHADEDAGAGQFEAGQFEDFSLTAPSAASYDAL